ncbi:MAG: ABC transporter substrate-binding protein [Candidatus Contendobacter sp.]|nr:ABC transporter substrate-binding protein [Candidatus Contendobacter sp.]
MHAHDNSKDVTGAIIGWRRLRDGMALGLLLGLSTVLSLSWAEEPGVTDKTIRIGSILPLEGDYMVYGLAMKQGMDAALAGQMIQGRTVELNVLNNFNEPITTIEVARTLIDQGVFMMLGNVGTLASLKLMPVLAANKLPALGFYTSGQIQTDGDMLNFRPGHAQEINTLVTMATDAGVKPAQICLFVQNDADGLAGIDGLKTGLKKLPNTQDISEKLDQNMEVMMGGINPALNNVGPVGFYPRGTVRLREGYQSLKNWENTSKSPCRLVIMVATPKVAADFIAYALYKNESWSFAAISSTAAGDALKNLLLKNDVHHKVIVTQVVPALDSPLPLLADARKALGPQLNPVSLEGFIVGRLFLAIARSINGAMTRVNFVEAAHRQAFDLGGLKIDFTKGNSGSGLVLLDLLNDDKYETFSLEAFKKMLHD